MWLENLHQFTSNSDKRPFLGFFNALESDRLIFSGTIIRSFVSKFNILNDQYGIFYVVVVFECNVRSIKIFFVIYSKFG